MADEKFRLPRSSYDQLARIIQAYQHFSAEATLDDVAGIAGIQRTIVSANNGFLADATIVAGGNKKTLTDRGRVLARALQYEHPEEIRRIWQEIIDDTDFLRGVLSAVRIRRGMEPVNLQSHIAYSAGLTKSKGVMTGAVCVIDILTTAGLLREEEGKLVTTSSEDRPPRNVTAVTQTGAAISGAGTSRVSVIGRAAPSSEIAFSRAPVQIQIQVQCKASELDELAPKLRAFLNDVNRPIAPDDE